MPFPFIPTVVVVAAAVLFSAIAGFVAGMMAIDRTATRIFGSVVSDVVTGARQWRNGLHPVQRRPSDEPRPITTAALDAMAIPSRTAAPAASVEGPAGEDPLTSVVVDEHVEPIETLDHVRPRVR